MPTIMMSDEQQKALKEKIQHEDAKDIQTRLSTVVLNMEEISSAYIRSGLLTDTERSDLMQAFGLIDRVYSSFDPRHPTKYNR